MRTLIAEDQSDDAELLVRALKKAGYEVTYRCVDSSEAFRAALESERWDVVLSDWNMPGFGATDALEILRAVQPETPLLIVSGAIGEEAAVTALRGGARDFILKENLARLAPAIDRELGEAASRRERKRVEAQLVVAERLATVGMLSAAVAHEINNPLAVVLANLELALASLDGADPAALEELHDANDAARRIREIVADVRMFSRGSHEPTKAVDIRRVLESSLRMARIEIRQRARLVTNLAPVPPVLGSESRLGQVFLNLLVNAAQAIPLGQTQANVVAVATGVDDRDNVVITIADTGCGMDAAAKETLFTPFQTTKEATAGTGLGLFISQRIVTELGGDIGVESEPGKGSTFRVRIPASRAGTAPRDSAERVPSPSLPPRRRARVLIVDDDASVGAVLQRVLGTAHDVRVTTSSSEALAMIDQGDRYDAIICDLAMPRMTGMDLHAALKSLSRDQADRMIFVTGGAFTAEAMRFFESVTNDRLEKPFDFDRLRALVAEKIDKSESRLKAEHAASDDERGASSAPPGRS